MQLKLKVLIFGSVLTLVALIAIQGYLIYNSYELKKKTITIDARNAIAKLYNTPEIDSIFWTYRNDFKANLTKYEKDEISQTTLLNRLQEKAKAINPSFMEVYSKGLEEYANNIDVEFKKIVTSITVTDSLGTTDVLYTLEENDTILIAGMNFSSEEGLLINNSTWQDNHIVPHANGESEQVDLNFKSSIYMSISNWNTLIIKELAGLMIISTLLFLFVVGLLYYSIQNLIKQKKVADIKTDFINNITHELKTPLSTLSLATKTLTNEYANDNKEMADEAINIVNRQNIRLQKLIDQVLQSSLGYKSIILTTEEFNTTLFLNETLDDFLLSVEHGIEVKRNIDSTGMLMIADKFYLSTAIINILNNAVKYGGTVLTVTYKVGKNNSSHLISIADNGIGISEKYQKAIFEKFYRVSEQDTHNYKGLGLGLYYTSQIIKAHNGSISVESREGHGTTFTISIPLAR